MRYGRGVFCVALAVATVTPLGGVAQGASEYLVPAATSSAVVSQTPLPASIQTRLPAPRAYCAPLRAALRSSRAALFLTGPRRQRALLLTEYRYGRAAELSRKAPVARAMASAGAVYGALRDGDGALASSASQRRFAAVPPAAYSVRRDCRVDLRRPVDYVFRISMATSGGG